MSSNVVTHDYIVIGSGSAGAIVAARLTDDPKVDVLLLEAGIEDGSPWSNPNRLSKVDGSA